jgi:hypothetical protein
MAVEHGNHVQAERVGKQLHTVYIPLEFFGKDGKWYLDAGLGDIYLKYGWLAEADHEYSSVLAAVQPGEPHWGKSEARKKSAYGLACTNALRGSYSAALKWLEQAPGEYNSGCGNCNEATKTRYYPTQVVWTAASKPFSDAEAELKEIMGGQFRPMKSELNGDTSEQQRQNAASEAALALGCLFYDSGDRANAETSCKLITSDGSPLSDAGILARGMLSRMRNE